jgi:hypothetical protein
MARSFRQVSSYSFSLLYRGCVTILFLLYLLTCKLGQEKEKNQSFLIRQHNFYHYLHVNCTVCILFSRVYVVFVHIKSGTFKGLAVKDVLVSSLILFVSWVVYVKNRG